MLNRDIDIFTLKKEGKSAKKKKVGLAHRLSGYRVKITNVPYACHVDSLMKTFKCEYLHNYSICGMVGIIMHPRPPGRHIGIDG